MAACSTNEWAHETSTATSVLVPGACYPYAAPVVKFETPCFHPNVDQHGNICLDILKVRIEPQASLRAWLFTVFQDKWSACYNIRTILLSIQSMLGDPNNESPLNGYAATLWDNQDEFRKTLLRKWVEMMLWLMLTSYVWRYEEDKKDTIESTA